MQSCVHVRVSVCVCATCSHVYNVCVLVCVCVCIYDMQSCMRVYVGGWVGVCVCVFGHALVAVAVCLYLDAARLYLLAVALCLYVTEAVSTLLPGVGYCLPLYFAHI